MTVRMKLFQTHLSYIRHVTFIFFLKIHLPLPGFLFFLKWPWFTVIALIEVISQLKDKIVFSQCEVFVCFGQIFTPLYFLLCILPYNVVDNIISMTDSITSWGINIKTLVWFVWNEVWKLVWQFHEAIMWRFLLIHTLRIITVSAADDLQNIFTFYRPQTSCCVFCSHSLWLDVGLSFSLWFHLQPKKTHERKRRVDSKSANSFHIFISELFTGAVVPHQEPYGGLKVAAQILLDQHLFLSL